MRKPPTKMPSGVNLVLELLPAQIMVQKDLYPVAHDPRPWFSIPFLKKYPSKKLVTLQIFTKIIEPFNLNKKCVKSPKNQKINPSIATV
jgi:hypothetical protein